MKPAYVHLACITVKRATVDLEFEPIFSGESVAGASSGLDAGLPQRGMIGALH